MTEVKVPSHLPNARCLVTSYEQTRAGFVAMALEKNREATPFIHEAKTLKVIASAAKTPKQLLKIDDIRPSLLTAAGLSEKAITHLAEQDKDNAINGLIEQFLEPAGEKFIEELVYRFLLIRGDALGGKMRNIIGVFAERLLSRMLIAALSLRNKNFWALNKNTNQWFLGDRRSSDIENNIRGLAWANLNGQNRTLIYNLRVPLVKKNVDLVLLNSHYDNFTLKPIKNSSHNIPENYIALGELKGGIDPAGADEHWKTARTALSRIRSSFAGKSLYPKTFFIGAAIENDMATELWNQLSDETLSYAANLTEDSQLVPLCSWLINL